MRVGSCEVSCVDLISIFADRSQFRQNAMKIIDSIENFQQNSKIPIYRLTIEWYNIN